MRSVRGLFVKIALAATAVSAIGAPALARDWDHDRDRYDYRDRDDWDRYGYHDRYGRDRDDIWLRGPGADELHPWFRKSRAGREYAARRAGTHITNREAWMLNREAPDDGDRRYRRRW